MIRLTIDTSAGIATAVLSQDSELLGAISTRGSVLALLHANIGQVLDAADMAINQIEEICVVIGPGSWTGLHVGVTTAKTISRYLNAPLVELSMLEALARAVPATTQPIVALLDAKREFVYSAGYVWGEGNLRTFMQPAKRHIEETMRLAADQSRNLIFVGALHLHKFAKKYFPDDGTLVETGVSYPSPRAFIDLAENRSAAGVSGTALFDVVPDYMGEDFTITPSTKVIR